MILIKLIAVVWVVLAAFETFIGYFEYKLLETGKLSTRQRRIASSVLNFKLFHCAKCSGFWFGLFMTQNFYDACIVSVGSELLSRAMKYMIKL